MNWVASLVILSLALAAIGAIAMRLATEAPVDPAVRAQRVTAAWLEVAIELCRADGAISETEIEAIERALTQRGLSGDAAKRAVSDALLRPIGASKLPSKLAEIAKLAPPDQRAACLAALGEVAASDGEISRDERALLDRARAVLS